MSDTHRFFVATTDAACEDMRARLNGVLGYPSPDTESLFPPASACMRSQSGQPLVVIDAPLLEPEAIATELAAILLGGPIIELTRQQYDNELPPRP